LGIVSGTSSASCGRYIIKNAVAANSSVVCSRSSAGTTSTYRDSVIASPVQPRISERSISTSTAATAAAIIYPSSGATTTTCDNQYVRNDCCFTRWDGK
jgi:hypothetical protein